MNSSFNTFNRHNSNNENLTPIQNGKHVVDKAVIRPFVMFKCGCQYHKSCIQEDLGEEEIAAEPQKANQSYHRLRDFDPNIVEEETY